MEFLPLFIAVIPLFLALHKIRWGVWFFIVTIPAYALRVPLVMGGYSLEISMVEIAAMLLIGYFLVGDRRPYPWPARSFARRIIGSHCLLIASTLLFTAGLFVSLVQSNDIAASLGIIRGWVLAPILFAVLLGVWMRREHISPRFIISAFLVSGVAVALAAPFWVNGWGGGRLKGFYESSNYLAMYLAPLLPLYVWYLRQIWDWRAVRLLVLGAFAAAALAVVFSLSRGAWIGLGLAGIVGTLMYGRIWLSKNWGVFVFAAASLAALAMGALVFTPFQDSLRGAFLSRVGIWEAALAMVRQSPVWGVGAGMFQTAFMTEKHFVAYPVPIEVALHPHNTLLAAWLYGGLLGLFGFLGILFALGRRIYTKQKAGILPAFAGAIALSFVIILVHGLVDTTYWKNDLAFYWWIAVALLFTRAPR